MILSILWFLIIGAVLYWIFTLIPFPQPGKNIALAVVLLLLLMYFLSGDARLPGLFT
jgi:hypothetical protein